MKKYLVHALLAVAVIATGQGCGNTPTTSSKGKGCAEGCASQYDPDSLTIQAITFMHSGMNSGLIHISYTYGKLPTVEVPPRDAATAGTWSLTFPDWKARGKPRVSMTVDEDTVGFISCNILYQSADAAPVIVDYAHAGTGVKSQSVTCNTDRFKG